MQRDASRKFRNRSKLSKPRQDNSEDDNVHASNSKAINQPDTILDTPTRVSSKSQTHSPTKYLKSPAESSPKKNAKSSPRSTLTHMLLQKLQNWVSVG